MPPTRKKPGAKSRAKTTAKARPTSHDGATRSKALFQALTTPNTDTSWDHLPLSTVMQVLVAVDVARGTKAPKSPVPGLTAAEQATMAITLNESLASLFVRVRSALLWLSRGGTLSQAEAERLLAVVKATAGSVADPFGLAPEPEPDHVGEPTAMIAPEPPAPKWDEPDELEPLAVHGGTPLPEQDAEAIRDGDACAFDPTPAEPVEA